MTAEQQTSSTHTHKKQQPPPSTTQTSWSAELPEGDHWLPEGAEPTKGCGKLEVQPDGTLFLL